MQPVIYAIRNRITGVMYIGSAVNYVRRCFRHKAELRHNKHHNIILQRAWNKYSEGAFQFEIVEHVANIEMLLPCEQAWIDWCAELGLSYNLAPVAGTTLGLRLTPEQCAALSKAFRDRKSTR